MSQKIEQQVQRALAALRGADYSQAEEVCRALTAELPSEADLYNLLAVAQMGLGKLSDAEFSLSAALAIKPREAMFLANLAKLKSQMGQLDEAIGKAREALELNPHLAAVHVLLATTLMAKQEPKQAQEAFNIGLQYCPQDALLHYNAAMLHQQTGDFVSAEHVYRRALELNPRFAEARNNLGNVLKILGRKEEAIHCFRSALSLQPHLAPAHSNLGLMLQEDGQHTEAIGHLSEAVRLNPQLAEAHNNLGFSYLEQENFEAAELCFRKAISLNPEMAEAHNNLGTTLHHLDRIEEAVDEFNEAFRLRPQYAEALFNLGMIFHAGKNYSRAKEYYQKAISLNPGYDSAHVNLGIIFGKDHDTASEIECYQRALQLNPRLQEAHHNLAMNLLRDGRWSEAWPEFAWRNTNAHHPLGPRRNDGTLPQVDLDNLAGERLIIHSEQGIGDTLCYLRFAQQLKERGASLSFCGDPRIVPMVMRSEVFDESLALTATLPNSVRQVLVGDLPYVCRCTDPMDLPPPYPLRPLKDRIRNYQERLAALGPPPYIGVTWRAGTKPTSAKFNVLYKHLPIRLFGSALTGLSGTVVSVQRLPRQGELEALEAASQLRIYDYSSMNDDLEDALALMSVLDVYIGVSNTNTHLRASVGKASYTLVPYPPEWRWGKVGSESAWCPGSAIFRQQAMIPSNDAVEQQSEEHGWSQAVSLLSSELAAYKTVAQ